MGERLTDAQIALIRTLWELAQGRIDGLYSTESAEQEKLAIEEWMRRVFSLAEYSEWIRAYQPTERG
ncbi:hypothetical protein [Gorillibacterium sp. sgz5001074]|uniref:hypothetical protein n=1 Tax=Gorillibacterium sp. sgz5001074 TaxID=3446695 RepID=UPI003F673C5D